MTVYYDVETIEDPSILLEELPVGLDVEVLTGPQSIETISLEDAVIEVSVLEQHTEQVEIIIPGPAGPPGLAGPAGSAGTVQYNFVNLATWTVHHNLNRVPGIWIFSDDGTEVIADVENPDPNTTVVTHGQPISGFVVLI